MRIGISMAQNAGRRGAAMLAAGLIGACVVPVGIHAAQSPAAPPPASVAPAPPTLPGGANALQERHGDWRLSCEQPNNERVCAFSQQQTKPDSHQLVLGIELKTTGAEKSEGTLVLPFGIAVDKPVGLQIDDAGETLSLRVRTGVPVGCVVPLTLEPSLVRALKKGKAWTVKLTADGGQELTLVSLNGFASALDRTAARST
jgi:invasion protein IalB